VFHVQLDENRKSCIALAQDPRFIPSKLLPSPASGGSFVSSPRQSTLASLGLSSSINPLSSIGSERVILESPDKRSGATDSGALTASPNSPGASRSAGTEHSTPIGGHKGVNGGHGGVVVSPVGLLATPHLSVTDANDSAVTRVPLPAIAMDREVDILYNCNVVASLERLLEDANSIIVNVVSRWYATFQRSQVLAVGAISSTNVDRTLPASVVVASTCSMLCRAVTGRCVHLLRTLCDILH